MYKTLNYSNTGKTIYDWESQFYQNKINDDIYELYDASIDTAFCLVNKKYEYNDYNVRIAGNFTAKHLPWYIENEIYNIYENYKRSINANTISSISKTIKEDIENNCLKIYKNNEMFFIKNNECNQNLSFWKNTYSIWETETFEIFDKHLSQDKIFIDIGGWIGTTAMYGSRKSKHVYSIEADNQSCHDLMINLKSNCVENYTVINKAIFNVDNLKIMFGKNVHLSNSKLNDSTSHIYDNVVIQNDCYLVKTITLEKIIQTYQINIPEISLIKVDIEGGEENILNDLFDMRIKHNISLYIRFHYSWWKDKNLDRFVFLSENVKNRIIHYPFISIFF
jgi:FkbM family methyltransferase